MRPNASLSSLACRPLSSVNTFRSTSPGRYGHGLGFVTKNLGKRNGALTRPPHSIVTQTFMLRVNAEEKTLAAANSTDDRQCPARGHYPPLDFDGKWQPQAVGGAPPPHCVRSPSPANAVEDVSREGRARRGNRQPRGGRRHRRSTADRGLRIRPRSSCPWPAA